MPPWAACLHTQLSSGGKLQPISTVQGYLDATFPPASVCKLESSNELLLSGFLLKILMPRLHHISKNIVSDAVHSGDKMEGEGEPPHHYQ